MTSNAEFIFMRIRKDGLGFPVRSALVMCGLDVTKNAAWIGKTWSFCCRGAEGLRENRKDAAVLSGQPGYRSKKAASIHDAVTFMYLLHPEIFQGEKMYVQVDCSRGISRGATVCDRRSGARAGASGTGPSGC